MSDVLPLYYFLTVHDIQSFLYLTVICWAALQIIDNAWRLGIADIVLDGCRGCLPAVHFHVAAYSDRSARVDRGVCSVIWLPLM